MTIVPVPLVIPAAPTAAAVAFLGPGVELVGEA